MFKRVERKRKRREEEEEMGLDEAAREIMGLNDTDSDESDSDSEQEFDNSDADMGEAREEEEPSGDEGADEDPPLSVGEALKDPIYLISLDPTVYGCVLCKGKLIKNAGMATAHKNANVHKRRFEQFRLLSANADPRGDAQVIVGAIQSASNRQAESHEPSKRALKRQVKQATIREKRKRHKELKAKAIARKASKKLSATEETTPAVPPKTKVQRSSVSQNQPIKTRKKQKLESKTSTSETRKSRTRSLSDDEKSNLTSRVKRTRKANKPS